MSINVVRFFMGKGLGRVLPGSSKLATAAYQRLWPDGHVVEVQGSRMYVKLFDPDPSMQWTFRAYASNRVHERGTTALFTQTVRPGDVVLDLGANVGYFTLLAARQVGKTGRVYAFEPEPRNYRYLRKNIDLNGYEHVAAFKKAVADKSGTVKLFLCPYDTGHHTIQSYGGIEAYRSGYVTLERASIDVEKINLDEFLAGRRTPINVIKMDVEGAEALALAGMEQIIQENERLVMFVEFFPLLIREMGQSPEEFARRLLEVHRFRMSVIGHDYEMHNRNTPDLVPVRSVEELMELCQGRTAHVNLYLEKNASSSL